MNKMEVTLIEKGLDFLGFNIRKYKTHNGSQVRIKPSNDSIKTVKRKQQNDQVLVSKLNPVIIGQ
ncbi:hypothetical protein ACPA2L_30375 [Bacillus bombysepticus]